MNPALLLARAARLHADRPALAIGTRVIASYAEFAARVAGWPVVCRSALLR
jgi:hypothetical protein